MISQQPVAEPCPCGGPSYAACCEPLHDGVAQADTCEQLMRSRYSAYALDRVNYVFRTWHPRTRPQSIEPSELRWSGLEIVETVDGGVHDSSGLVEFIASYDDRGTLGRLRERSRFERRKGRWLYVDAAA